MVGDGRLSRHTEKKLDNWSRSSKKKLKAAVEHKMNRIFVGILNVLDKARLEGKIEDSEFKRLRSEILNIGNDQVRNIKKELDDRYNVEFIPYQIEFKIIPA